MTKCKFPSLNDVLCQVWLKLPNWFWRRRSFLKFRKCTSAIFLSSPLGKGQGSWFAQTWVLISQVCIVPNFKFIGPVVLEKKIFKFRKCIFSVSFINPLRKRAGAFRLNKLEFPRMLCANLVEIGPVVLEKKMKMWKAYDNDDDDGQVTNFDQKSSFETSTEVSWND